MAPKKICSNYNHSRSYITIKFCPQCGEKFGAASTGFCDDDKHKARRKERDTFCCDCGKNLKKELSY